MNTRWWFVRLMTILAILGALPASGIVRGSVPAGPPDPGSPSTPFPTEDMRFDAIGAFATTWRLGFPYDPPPVESGPNNWYCSAVLISPTLVVTARHCAYVYGPIGLTYPHAVRFRRRLDGGLGTVAAGPDSFFHAFIDHFVELSPFYGDVIFAVLNEPVTHITPLTVAPPLKDGETSPGFLAGWGSEGETTGAGPREKLNYCETFVIHTSSGGNTFAYPSAFTEPFPCGTNQGDSGGGVLIERDGQLQILGIVNGPTQGTFVPAEVEP